MNVAAQIFSFFVDPFRYEFMQRALAASVVVGVVCGVLGAFIILRGMALIGDALSHAVLPGVVVGFAFAGQQLHLLFVGAVVAGVLCTLNIGFVQRNTRLKPDTATGVVFTAYFALGILIVSQLKRVHVDLQGYLFGDVLGVSTSDLWFICVVGPLVLAAIALFFKQLMLISFDPTMASSIGINVGRYHYFLMLLLTMTVVTSLQAVGLVLVVAMLIVPGATAYLVTHRLSQMLVLAAIFGAASAVLGLFLSYHLNFASGAAMVLVAFVWFNLVLLFSPVDGLAVRLVRRWRASHQTRLEDFLKAFLSIQVGSPPITDEKVRARVHTTHGLLQDTLKHFRQKKWIQDARPRGYELTPAGTRKALEIVRAHRLWETFLSEKLGLSWDKLDVEAERVEHLLTPQMLEQLDESLAHPRVDPHGAPIPTPEGEVQRPVTRPLLEMNVGERGVIARVKDEDARALQVLNERGITPKMALRVLEKSPAQDVTIEIQGQQHRLERDVAEHILVS
jgi:ABC-type Mn2+/Zn2+ transport system permease subunit/Mn-dependent DtxR family transcriptional regulator